MKYLPLLLSMTIMFCTSLSTDLVYAQTDKHERTNLSSQGVNLALNQKVSMLPQG